jgi:hypothetical protein
MKEKKCRDAPKNGSYSDNAESKCMLVNRANPEEEEKLTRNNRKATFRRRRKTNT